MSDKSLARLVDLVPYISTHQGVHVTELARVFDVSVKQIEQDLMTLFMCGYPFYQPMEVNFEDGEVTIANADELARVRKFSKTEVVSLLIGLNSLQISDPELEQLKIKLSNFLKPLDIQNPPKDLKIYFDAISRNEIIEISYISIDRDQVSNRQVIPFGLYTDGGATYLRSFCLLTRADRTFRIDRIVDAKIVGKSDITNISDSVPNYSGKSFVEIRRNRRFVLEYFQSKNEEISFYSDVWFIKSVMAMAGSVKVKDSALKAEIARRAEQARALYD